jgi:hypothetical protein
VGEDDNLVLLYSFHDVVPGRCDLIRILVTVWVMVCVRLGFWTLNY